MTDFPNITSSVGGVGVAGGHRRTLRSLASPYKITLMIMIDEHCKMMRTPVTQTLIGDLYTDAQECELIIVMLRLVQVGNI